MGDCGVCLDFSDGEAAELYSHCERVARKPHKCDECEATIRPGERYHYDSGRFDGQWFDGHTCVVCDEIGRGLSCGGGYLHGNLWVDIREMIFPDMTLACVGRLTTAAAKQKLLDEWRAWKELDGVAR